MLWLRGIRKRDIAPCRSHDHHMNGADMVSINLGGFRNHEVHKSFSMRSWWHIGLEGNSGVRRKAWPVIGERYNQQGHMGERCNQQGHMGERCNQQGHMGERCNQQGHMGERCNQQGHMGERCNQQGHMGERCNQQGHMGGVL